MNTQEFKEKETKSINLILLAVSFIICGILGIVFITQMELHPGWVWDEEAEKYPIEFYSLDAEDINNDGVNDIFTYADIRYRNSEISPQYDTPQYGAIFTLNGVNGQVLWSNKYTGPIKRAFKIQDVNGDMYRDYLVNIAAVNPNWTGSEQNNVEVYPNMFTNTIISGFDGSDLSELPQIGKNFTNLFISDLISLDEDLICLEVLYDGFLDKWSWNITAYYINGTLKHTTYVDDVHVNFSEQQDIPKIELFSYNDEPHLLYLGSNSIRLLNLSASNFLNYTYNEPIFAIEGISTHTVIEDLNSDGISEILIATHDDEILLINGGDGNHIRNFSVAYEIGDTEITEIPSLNDGEAYFAIETSLYHGGDNNELIIEIYSITLATQNVEWNLVQSGASSGDHLLVLDEDIDGDSINEIVYQYTLRPIGVIERIARYKIFNFINRVEYGVINVQYSADEMIKIDDFDKNGRNDFLVTEGGRIMALSTKKPTGIWLSSEFSFGLPLFIVLTVLLGAGVLILIIKSKDLRVSRKVIKESIKNTKLTIAVNILTLILMTLCFILFLFQLNIFNSTLISNFHMTSLIVIFITVIILWYAILPITAAIYNQFSPNFAMLLIRLRNLFFKISKSYNHEILVVDMKDRRNIGIVIQIKRTILPLLLSIAVGFFVYNYFAPLLGYSQGFTQFASTEFFSFIIGYMSLCLLPIILTYPLFAFFISGNFLLDDAGIVYFRESKKYRQPGDIEPISIWAQSLVKGVAGLSALITFGSFFITVNFSGFFQGDNILFVIFGVLMVIVMFWGAPFFTGFSYILLAGEVMEYTVDTNTQKLYRKMEKKGYDTTPHDITNIYPLGYEPSKKETFDKIKDTESASN